MFRVVVLAVTTTVALFAVLGVVVVVGFLRLSGSQAVAIAPTTMPADAATAPVTSVVTETQPPLAATDEAEGEERAGDSGYSSIYLDADQAELSGKARVMPKKKDANSPQPSPDKVAKHHHAKSAPPNWIGGWREPDDLVSWHTTLPASGKYEIDLVYATPDGAGGSFDLTISDQNLTGHTELTKSGQAFRMFTLATVNLAAGPATVTMKPRETNGKKPLMNLRAIKLIPAD